MTSERWFVFIHVTFDIVTYSNLRIYRKWKYWLLRKTQSTTSTFIRRATEFTDAFSALHWGVLACKGRVNIITWHVNVYIGACPAEEVLSKYCKNMIHIFMSIFSTSVVTSYNQVLLINQLQQSCRYPYHSYRTESMKFWKRLNLMSWFDKTRMSPLLHNTMIVLQRAKTILLGWKMWLSRLHFIENEPT